MLLPNNIAPEDSIYYNGAIVLDIVQREHRISLANLFCEVNKSKSLSFSMFLLCLDWLYLINCVSIQNEEVVLCS
jgi:hypothetical protein